MNWSLLTVAVVAIAMFAVMFTTAQETKKSKKYKCVADEFEISIPNTQNCAKFFVCDGKSTEPHPHDCRTGQKYNATTMVSEKRTLKFHSIQYNYMEIKRIMF